MRTETIAIYTLSELSEGAQERAHNDYLSIGDTYHWNSENKESLEAFADLFSINIKDWQYGYRDFINWTISAEDEVKELSGPRLSAYLQNNYYETFYKAKEYKKGKATKKSRITKEETSCPLTGYYCVDDTLIQPMRDFIKKPDSRTFEDLVNDCLNAWLSSCSADHEYSQSFEAFKETAEANEWEFTESGEMA